MSSFQPPEPRREAPGAPHGDDRHGDGARSAPAPAPAPDCAARRPASAVEAADPRAAAEAEAERVEAVRATGLVGVEAGERLDRIARQVALVARAPIAMISLVDADRQWNPGVWGAGAPREAPRELSMCSRAIESSEPYVVPDTAQDREWADNPGVAGPPEVRFYAGQPIDDGAGHLLGVLCVVDFVPREADDALLDSLRDLAVWARHELLATRPPAPAGAPTEGAPAEDAATGGAATRNAPAEDVATGGAATRNAPAEDAATGGAATRNAPTEDAATASTDDAPTAATVDATNERLEELGRLQSLVVSTTAHQLRTPLTVLRVHAELLQNAAGRLSPDEQASLAAISGAVSRLQTASDDLVSDLRGSAGGAEEALKRWLKLEEGSGRIRPLNEPDDAA